MDGEIAVKWELILETMQRQSTASVVLVLIMAVVAGLIINQILKVGIYTTLASIPALLLAGLFAHALLMINHIMLSPNKASNTVLSASFGFIVFAAVCFGVYRAWNSVQERRSRISPKAEPTRNLRGY
ncbi:MAG: hypothetical protein ACI9XZ_000371 [Alphaproteobacteria bacterium]